MSLKHIPGITDFTVPTDQRLSLSGLIEHLLQSSAARDAFLTLKQKLFGLSATAAL
jgi:hypothetical protein